MKLAGKLKEEFEEWLKNQKIEIDVFTDYYYLDIEHLDQLPLSMQFALLCDFLETNNPFTNTYVDVYYDVNYTKWESTVDDTVIAITETKEEAITKAIQYLNDNY